MYSEVALRTNNADIVDTMLSKSDHLLWYEGQTRKRNLSNVSNSEQTALVVKAEDRDDHLRLLIQTESACAGPSRCCSCVFVVQGVLDVVCRPDSSVTRSGRACLELVRGSRDSDPYQLGVVGGWDGAPGDVPD